MCRTPKGFIKNCVMSNVRCKYIEAENAVLINVTAERIVAKPFSVVYNLLDDKNSPHVATGGVLQLDEKDVVVGVFDEDGQQFVVRSHMDTDGGKAWEMKVSGNSKSFEEVYNGNTNACPTTLERVIASSHDEAWRKI
ncbi:hypothetical protein EON65_39660 [archaeon]|nr:MAG: hypothetical protein EON65_39660 [archaeon]